MGVTSDLVLADRSEVEKIESSLDPVEEFGGVNSRIDMVSMCSLMSIISKDSKYLDEMDGFDLLNESEEGPWITSIHPDFCEIMLQLEAQNSFQTVVSEWISTEELVGMPLETALSYLVDFVQLAKDSRNQGKEIFMINQL